MRGKLTKILLAVLICIGVAAIVLLCVGTFVGQYKNNNYWSKVIEFQNKLQTVGTTFVTFGSGNETQNAIDDYLNSIPENVRQDSNIILIDKNGTILKKTNNKYLHTDSDRLAMIWSSPYAAILDEKNSQKYWFSMQYFSMVGELDYDTVYSASATPLNETPEKLKSMINAYSSIDKTEADVTAVKIENKDTPLYLFWFRGKGVDSVIYDSFGRYDSQSYLNFTYGGTFLLLLYWILAPVWVFLDARRRKTQPLPWALLVLLTNIVGLIVYWIVQSQSGKASSGPACPACGKPVQTNHLYCPWCSEALVKCCKGCGKPLEKEWVSCPWCGKPVE
jgi:hypothetical protein